MKLKGSAKAQIRTTICLSLFTVSILVLSGCKDSSSKFESDNERTDFIMQLGKADDFYVLYSSLDDAKAPRYIVYLFNGSIQNNTGNTYANVTLRLTTSIELENGTVLTKAQIDQNMLGGALSFTTFSDFKPKEKIEIRRLESFQIPVEYASYPVQDVTVEYSVETEDQINQTNEQGVIKAVSVIEKWKHATAKVKANMIDASDDNFLDKVLGRGY